MSEKTVLSRQRSIDFKENDPFHVFQFFQRMPESTESAAMLKASLKSSVFLPQSNSRIHEDDIALGPFHLKESIGTLHCHPCASAI
jgi:hypothetical protein